MTGNTKPVRIKEKDHATVKEIAEHYDISMAKTVNELLFLVDMDEVEESLKDSPRCPWCGRVVTHEELDDE